MKHEQEQEQVYMSPEALGLDPAQYQALIDVMGELRAEMHPQFNLADGSKCICGLMGRKLYNSPFFFLELGCGSE